MIDRLISLIAPHSCLSCQRDGSALCPTCLQDICDDHQPFCIGCGLPNDRGVCDDCSPQWPIERALVVAKRSGTVKTLIDEFKYNHKRAAYKELAQLAASLLPYSTDAMIVPLPTISRHIRQRGYDHAALTARQIARKAGLRYAPVLRRQGSSVQHEASKRDRATQAATAYFTKGRLDPDELYILFDDIVTTGASLKAAIRVLQDAGAEHIWTLAIARQPLDADR